MFNDDDAPALQHAFLRCTSEPILILKISIKITNFDKVLNQQFQSQNVTIDFEESSRASFVCERNFAIVMTTKKTFGLLRFFLLRSSRNLFFFVDFSMATASSQSLLSASSAGAVESEAAAAAAAAATAAAESALQYLHGAGIRTLDSATADRCATNEH